MSDGGTPTGEGGAAPAAAPEPVAPVAAAPAPVAPAAPAPAAPAAAERPEGLPDDLWDATTGLKTGDLVAKYRDATAKLAEDAAARGAVPDTAEGYDLKLPDGFTVPDGFKVEIDPKDPAIAAATAAALAAGMTQKDMSRALQVEAIRQIEGQKAAVAAYASEKAALGANANDRIKAVDAWMTTNLPTSQAQALARLTTTKAGIEAVETIIKLRAGPPVGEGPKPPAPILEGAFGSSRLAAIRNRAA